MFDVLILGAGPAGCSTAGMLAKKGYSVLVLNKHQPNKIIVGENLDASSKVWFSYLEIDEDILNYDHLPAYNLTSLWSSEIPVSKDSIYSIYGNGWHLDRKKFDNYLLNIMIKNGAIYDCYDSIDITEFDNCWSIAFQSGDRLYKRLCKFIVDCTGRNRCIARKFGITINRYDDLISINSFAEQKSLENSTFVEAAENGWWYSTVTSNNKRLISYYTNAKTKHFKAALEQKEFFRLANLTKLISGIGKLKIEDYSAIFVRYANSEISQTICGLNWMAVGDSAAAFDPLSSQGITTALKMAFYASHAIQDYFNNTGTGLPGFQSRYKQIFSQYLSERPTQYARVRKWPESDFWITQATKNRLINDTDSNNLIL